MTAADVVIGSAVAAAYVATITEGVVFYGTIFTRELAAFRPSGRARPGDRLHVLRSMIVEFGGAELLDMLLVRPFLIATGFTLAGTPGTFAGKVAADVVFYAPVLAVHELRAVLRPR